MSQDEEDVEFLGAAKNQVLRYLDHSDVKYRAVAEQPDWYLAPYISIWPVFGQHAQKPGWFAIAGDVPTDYVSSDDANDARSAMRHFSRLWLEAAACMAEGKAHPSFKIGKPEDWPSLYPMLKQRGELLAEFAEDKSLWD